MLEMNNSEKCQVLNSKMLVSQVFGRTCRLIPTKNLIKNLLSILYKVFKITAGTNTGQAVINGHNSLTFTFSARKCKKNVISKDIADFRI